MCSASQEIRVTRLAQPTINPLARCICWAGLLGRAVFPPWNEGPNFGSYIMNELEGFSLGLYLTEKGFSSELKKKVKSLSRVRLFATLWTVAYQAPPSVEFSRQEYWSGLPFPSPGYLPNPGIEPRSPTLEEDALTSEPPGKPELTTMQYSRGKLGK